MNFNTRQLAFSHLVVLLVAYTCIGLFACAEGSAETTEVQEQTEDKTVKDGTYCADVTYYNSKTATKNTYTLNVEVENNELVKIYFPNGGWLDDSHFTPPELSSDRTCSFTSDKGYEYAIEITGPKCSFTSSDVVVEGNDEPRELRLTLSQCASAMNMTEQELTEYEQDFNVSRSAVISEKMCRSLYEYLEKKRELDRKKRSLESLMDNGYIQKMFSIGPDDDVRCQSMIVKRKGYYYLLEVQGSRKATMGLMDFDPSTSDWQEVKIMEDPGKPFWNVFYMRVVDQNSEMSPLEEEMTKLCTLW